MLFHKSGNVNNVIIKDNIFLAIWDFVIKLPNRHHSWNIVDLQSHFFPFEKLSHDFTQSQQDDDDCQMDPENINWVFVVASRNLSKCDDPPRNDIQRRD